MHDGWGSTQDAWCPESYAVNVEHHRRHAPAFTEAETFPEGARVLDVGCGVGDLLEHLAIARPDLQLVGVDASPKMIESAAGRSRENLSFRVRRAEELGFSAEFDAVISSACLHWVAEGDHPAALHSVHRALKPGGRFFAEFGGSGNVQRVLSVVIEVAADPRYAAAAEVGNPWFFPTAESYGRLLGASPFGKYRTRLELQRRRFTAAEFIGWLRSQTLLPWLAHLGGSVRAQFLAEVQERALAITETEDGVHTETFVRIHIEAHHG